MDMTIITAILSSSVIAAIISGLVSKNTNDKNMSLKYITEERASWRKLVKETISKIYAEVLKESPDENKIKEMVTYLIISLNPSDGPKNKLDQKISSLLFSIEKGQRDEDTLHLLRYHISLLMKHDWERSKNETKGFFSKETDEQINSRTLGEYFVQSSRTDETE